MEKEEIVILVDGDCDEIMRQVKERVKEGYQVSCSAMSTEKHGDNVYVRHHVHLILKQESKS